MRPANVLKEYRNYLKGVVAITYIEIYFLRLIEIGFRMQYKRIFWNRE